MYWNWNWGANGRPKLQLTTAPALLIFPPSTGPHADLARPGPIKFDFAKSQIPAEVVAEFIASNTAHTPKVRRPRNWMKIGTTSAIVLVSATVTKLAFPVLKPMLYSRNLWAALSLIAILLFTSGHMFNHIRKVPYIANNNRGGVSYVAGGFSNQYGLETQIVAVICTSSWCPLSLCLFR